MLTVKYFAYGSNIKIDRLKNRVEYFNEKLKPGIPFILYNYELVFNAGSKFDFWSFANIVPKNGANVEGILYDMTPEQFKRLDEFEVLYEKQYFQIDTNTIGCVYISKKDNISFRKNKPTLEYLNLIIDGCRETGLINTYNKLVEYKLANYKLKKNKHKQNVSKFISVNDNRLFFQ